MEQLRARLGPFPVWIWLALITAVGLAWWLYEQHKSGSSATQPAPEGTAQVPETVNQTTVDITPPAAPAPSAPMSTSGQLLTRNANGTAVVGNYTGSPADLFNIAKELGITEQQLLKDNPQLKSYEGTGKGIPTGTTIYTEPGQAPDKKKTTHPSTPHPGKPPAKGGGPVKAPAPRKKAPARKKAA